MLELPQIEYGDWLISALFEIGPAEITDMGAMQPIKQSEIAAYSYNHGVPLRSWEVSALRSMSEQYAIMRHSAKDINCPPPYTAKVEITPTQRATVDSFFRGLAARRGKR